MEGETTSPIISDGIPSNTSGLVQPGCFPLRWLRRLSPVVGIVAVMGSAGIWSFEVLGIGRMGVEFRFASRRQNFSAPPSLPSFSLVPIFRSSCRAPSSDSHSIGFLNLFGILDVEPFRDRFRFGVETEMVT